MARVALVSTIDDIAAEWNYYITVLMSQAGLTFSDACLWAGRLPIRPRPDAPPSLLARFIGEYLDAGFSAVEGFYWSLHQFDAEESVEWANRGWIPAQVDRLYDYLTAVGPRDRRRDRQNGRDWLHTGIPAHRVLLYASAACAPAEGLALEARRAAGEDVDSGLRTLAALLPRQ